MINLLPADYRAHLRHDRSNTQLHRWLVIGAFTIAGMLVVLASGWFYINKQVEDLSKSATATEALLHSKSLVNVQKQADEISQNILIINQVLKREIRFSDLIQQIGKVMPPGAVLGSLTLSKANGAIDITANTKNYSSAAQIAVNLGDPKNNIFAKVDVISIVCSPDQKTYPCTAAYRALFGKATELRFLNATEGDNQ